MTDELTPQEKEALNKLPRERMPLGLEARVVDAMREKGFLEKQRRTIAITNSRVAGLLAACVALMIATYSIGLHRGGSDRLVPSVATLERDDRRPIIDEPRENAEGLPSGDVADAEGPAPDKETDAEGTASPERREKLEADVNFVGETRRPGADADRSDTPPVLVEDVDVVQEPAAGADRSDVPPAIVKDVAKPSSPPTRSVERTKADRVRQVELKEEPVAVSEEEAPLQPAQETAVPQAAFNQSADPAQTRRISEDSVVSKKPQTFLLNGSPVVVEAPDSVRVIRDAEGRVLIIYTSDGVIRIRLADDD